MLLSALDKIGNNNSQGEYYLTDTVEIINESGGKIKSTHCDALEALGTNDSVITSYSIHYTKLYEAVFSILLFCPMCSCLLCL